MNITINKEGNGELHLQILKALCGETAGKSMMDLCCGFAPQTRLLGFSNKFYIDSVSRELGSENDNFLVIDIFEFIRAIPTTEIDTMFLLDAIEHFEKGKSFNIVRWMEDNSNKQIIFTPLGDYIIETTPTDNPDSHKSGWMPQEFNDMGWATITLPNFHPTLNIGAFFAFKCNNLENEFNRVKNLL